MNLTATAPIKAQVSPPTWNYDWARYIFAITDEIMWSDGKVTRFTYIDSFRDLNATTAQSWAAHLWVKNPNVRYSRAIKFRLIGVRHA